MKKRIASLLIRLAETLDPLAPEKRVRAIEGYEPKQIGCAWSVTSNDIRRFKRETGEKSTRKVMPKLIEKFLSEQRKAIINEAERMIETRVYKDSGQTIVESRLNVYAQSEEAADTATAS